ncbi:hypothetical protein RND81_08G012800 [Saponaria officinalis]|uniref:SMP-LTD domain-containing protein n=1 Tax=Saponaria officinalis TaxID=3572 RepID=A0AAW1J275_SAPOF
MLISAVLLLGFILGIFSVLAVEGFLILILIKRLSKGSNSVDSAVVTSQHPLDPRQSLHSLYQKQGVVWVLDPEKLPKVPAQADQTKKKEVVEVSPIRKHAKIKDRTLFLTEVDGSLTKVLLKGCQVVAVSASSMPTKKWAKLYPIKIESKNAVLYQGSKIFHIYAETSWDKESWCRALRLASYDDKERLQWHAKLSEEFRSYLKSLTEGYPFLIKPSVGFHGWPVDKVNRIEDPPSKVRQFWRKLSKKGSLPSHDEKRIADKARVPQGLASIPSMSKSAPPGKMTNGCFEDVASVSSSESFHFGSSTHLSEMSDADTSDKFGVDEGTLCLNLLMSRLFFDVKNNLDIKTALKDRIQRTLTNMRTPSYIGEVICNDVDPGHLPPHIHGMRAIPTDMNDLWALEMDIEYSGGVILYIEARLEVGELDSHNGMIDENIESTSSGDVPTNLLEDFKEELNLSAGATDTSHQLHTDDNRFDKFRGSKTGVSTSASGSRWKAILNSVAKHVSQVPLTLAIKVASLKGTIQLHVKPPPSDQLWFGFTSMPDIQFQLESSVKDHKITNGRIASFLISRFKASIRETLVLPNCESISVSWMLAEKDDWIPRSAAPLFRVNRVSPSETTTSNEDSNPQPSKPKTADRDLDSKLVKPKKADSFKQPVHEDQGQIVPFSAMGSSSSQPNPSSDELRAPLLQNGESLDCSVKRREETSESHSPSRYVSLKEESNSNDDDDAKPKKAGRKSRMFDLGKRMGEKIEEKRRHIEEKSRNIVEKMRGP